MLNAWANPGIFIAFLPALHELGSVWLYSRSEAQSQRNSQATTSAALGQGASTSPICGSSSRYRTFVSKNLQWPRARLCPSQSDKNSAKRSGCTRSIRFRTQDATRSPLSSGRWSELLVGSELLVPAPAASRTRRLRSRRPRAFRLCRGVKSSYFCPYLFS